MRGIGSRERWHNEADAAKTAVRRKLPRTHGGVRRRILAFDGTEFGGGTLARHEGAGSLLLILAMSLIFRYPRVAAASGLAVSYFSLPLFLYLVFPRPFRQVWGGSWSVPELPRETFVWNGWWAAGILFILDVCCICCGALMRSLAARLARSDGAATNSA